MGQETLATWGQSSGLFWRRKRILKKRILAQNLGSKQNKTKQKITSSLQVSRFPDSLGLNS
jgi:hypothetical protein